MSSFFTLPASQKKRKRVTSSSQVNGTAKRSKSNDIDSISGSDISDDDAPARVEEDVSEEDDDQFEGEDPASKRVRLAEQYLANTQKEVLEDVGFDAADVDQENLRRRMGERLKEDTAESKGKLYRRIADGLDWRQAKRKTVRCHNVRKSVTGVALHGKHIYGVSKDLHLVKWEMPNYDSSSKNKRQSQKIKVVAKTFGNTKSWNAPHHSKAILCVAISPDGKFVATGGADKKLIIWDAENLTNLRVFTHHRDAVTALAFRRGTNQLFSASKDRTVKVWSLNELAYVETLFGHRDEVLDVDALALEKCVTVGGRDRTARLWKVVDESQLVFRSGGSSGRAKAIESLKKAYEEDSGVDMQDERTYNEGSTDRIAMIDDETFVTASDNGSLSLWNINKKKAVSTVPLAHGLDPALPPDEANAELDPDAIQDDRSHVGKHPRWITALKAIPFSDVFVSGSWDGYVRAWKISNDKRRIEPLGALGAIAENVDDLLAEEGLTSDALTKTALNSIRMDAAGQSHISGIINDLSIVDSSKDKGVVLVAAAVGKEHRLGRWKEDANGKNYIVFFEVSPLSAEENGDLEIESANQGSDEGDFEGFE